MATKVIDLVVAATEVFFITESHQWHASQSSNGIDHGDVTLGGNDCCHGSEVFHVALMEIQSEI